MSLTPREVGASDRMLEAMRGWDAAGVAGMMAIAYAIMTVARVLADRPR